MIRVSSWACLSLYSHRREHQLRIPVAMNQYYWPGQPCFLMQLHLVVFQILNLFWYHQDLHARSVPARLEYPWESFWVLDWPFPLGQSWRLSWPDGHWHQHPVLGSPEREPLLGNDLHAANFHRHLLSSNKCFWPGPAVHWCGDRFPTWSFAKQQGALGNRGLSIRFLHPQSRLILLQRHVLARLLFWF